MFQCHGTGKLASPGTMPTKLPIEVWEAIYPGKLVRDGKKMKKLREGRGRLIAREALFSPEGLDKYNGPTVLGTKKFVEYDHVNEDGNTIHGSKWIIHDETNLYSV